MYDGDPVEASDTLLGEVAMDPTTDHMLSPYLLLVLLVALQIQHAAAAGCELVSVASPSASTLSVKWSSDPGASHYLLELRVVNSSTIAPVVVMVQPPSTHRLVQGLRPGRSYTVTLKVISFFNVLCTDQQITMTVPATSQILVSQPVSSSAIRLQWSGVVGADRYLLFVEELFGSQTFNRSFSGLSGQMDGLTSSTTYTCYVLSSNSAGRGARGRTKTILTLVQPPTDVSVTATSKSSASVSWSPVEKVLLYQVSVNDVDDPSQSPVITNTSSTHMDISDLQPCSNYTVGVASVNVFLLPGEAANQTHTTTPINKVTRMSVDYSCSSGTAAVSWDSVFGANAYRATAQDGTGSSLTCSSPSSSCLITGLLCGERYHVTVTAISDDCDSTSDSTHLFETVPCAPTHLVTSHECFSSVMVFNWQPTNNTLYYVASSQDNTGKVTQCRTSDNQCLFTNAGCGQLYQYNVYAVSSECNSELSQSEFIQTSPCLPTNVRTAAECRSDVLVTSWDWAEGALSYTVEAQGNTGESYGCSSTSNSCTVTGVPCGEHLSVWIVASNHNCSTSRVLGEVAQTVPCTPTNVSASVQCSVDSATIRWRSGNGAVFHIAQAEDESGKPHSCSSQGTSCLLEGLRCAHNYTASVIGTNLKCNSSSSVEVSFMTGPCPPDNVQALRDCDANHALIMWENHQPSRLFTATVEEQSGTQLHCSSRSNNSCKISALPCGRKYDVTVSYSHGTCLSTSTPISMDSVPCGPHSVNASMSCPSGQLEVTWSISHPAENYTTVISRGQGQPLYCNSTETTCTMEGLQCGASYTVVVFSVTGTCYSLPSPEVTVQTPPCPPTNVEAPYLCAPNPVPVSWVPSDGAKNYTAVAISATGHRDQCSSSSTSCSLLSLRCGERYTVGVSGVDDVCAGPLSDVVSLNTEPCTPSNVSSLLICYKGAAQVFWAPSSTAVGFQVKATSDGASLSCSSSSSNCTLNDLLCGREYDITVSATDGTCVSNTSHPLRQDPVPCQPLNVTTDLDCGSGELTVGWTSSSAAPLNYSVTAVPLLGSSSPAWCHSDGVSCSLTGLRCGQRYNVSVQGFSGMCGGLTSPMQVVQTAPCWPQGVTALADCDSNSVVAFWEWSPGASSYTATATGPDGRSKTCVSSTTSCSFSDLQCFTSYNITVTSEDRYCNSSASHVSIMTGPCHPAEVSSVLHCGSDSATVSWAAASGAVAYIVLAQEDSGHLTSCRSSTTSCQLDELRCGKHYSLTVMTEDASCNSTGANSAEVWTAPCAPSIIHSSLVCDSASSAVVWTQVANATSYVVNAMAQSGHSVSCRSDGDSCVLEELQCSESYEASVTAVGSECNSSHGAAFTFTTALCPPTSLEGQTSCDTNTLTLSWSPGPSNVSYILQTSVVGVSSPPSELLSSEPSHSLSDLPCGRTYRFHVSVLEGSCRGRSSPPYDISTAPCEPTNLTARVDCGTDRGNFSWTHSGWGATYVVEVTGGDDHVTSCSSNGTWCALKLQCGRFYSATLLATAGTCNSSSHANIHFDSAPCLPEEVLAEVQCDSSLMNVSWRQSLDSDDTYTAWAISSDGLRLSCNSSSNHCSINQLPCGRVYEVAVTSSSIHCLVIAGSDYRVQSAPCKPDNVRVKQNCSSKAVDVTWSSSGANSASSANNYTVTATPTVGANASCDSANGSCSFLHLQCGQRYTFTVTAHANVCTSDISSPADTHTAPCPPTNLSAEVTCGGGEAVVRWSSAAVSSGYSVLASSISGHHANCSSAGTSCRLSGLMCGQDYNVVVEAVNTGCPGPASKPIRLTAGPCAPWNVSLSYRGGVAQVLWHPADGAFSYSVAAGPEHGCNSSDSSCSLIGLQCSHTYSVTVTSHNQNQTCDNATSEPSLLATEPCPPTNVQAALMCNQSSVAVWWEPSPLAVGYVASVHHPQGGANSSCESSDPQCVALGLACGTGYHITVTAVGGQLNSSDSTPISLASAPCEPSAIAAVLDCKESRATVFWQRSEGAWSYVTELTSALGHTASCSSNHTHCEPGALRCGQHYIITVTAVGGACNSSAHMEGSFPTEPCAPGDLSVQYNASTAWVAWARVGGANWYWVEAVTEQGGTVSCNTSDNRCSLIGLRCSQTYDIIMTAQNQACNNSASSEPYSLNTEPCPPTNVQANVSCDQHSATVWWEGSALAVSYVTYFEDQDGHAPSCQSRGTVCVSAGLRCGSAYRVWVKAVGEQHNSSDTSPIAFTSAPCPPSDVVVEVGCPSGGGAVVWWTPPSGGANVSVSADATGESPSVCTSQQGSCQLTALSCGRTYNLTLSVSDEQCSLTAPTRLNLTTGPCPPQRVAVEMECGSGIALLSWQGEEPVELYTATAMKASGGGEHATCNSSGSSCVLSTLDCGEMYNLSVSAEAGGCSSTPSPSLSIHTGPCQPVMVSVGARCQGGQVHVTWQRANGVESYVVMATGSLGYTHTHNSSSHTELTTPLPCGQDYNLTVHGVGAQCDSAPSRPLPFTTAPCTPWGVVASSQCEVNAGSVSWEPSDGAESYVATATSLTGHAHHCVTNTTWCGWSELLCGEEHTVTVSAVGGNCSSPPSNTSLIHTVPCVPTDVAVVTDCANNTGAVSWSASRGAALYHVTAHSRHGNDSCWTANLRCDLTNLTCGAAYMVEVVAMGAHCSSPPSAGVPLDSGPCPPQNILATLDCESANITVSWDAVRETDHFLVSLSGQDEGTRDWINTTDTHWVFSDVACGDALSAQVASARGACLSEHSQSSSFQSVPCQPRGIGGRLDCVTNSAWISWEAEPGEQLYTVIARGDGGSTSNCSASTNWTCEVEDLTCGTNYNFTVTANNHRCDSVPTASISLHTAPCSLSRISVLPQCHNASILVMWELMEATEGDTVYTATAEGSDRSRLSCSSSSSSCSLQGALCGLRYTVIVTASSDVCSSRRSPPHRVTTEPCPPRNVEARASCGGGAVVSWSDSAAAESYYVVASSDDGHQQMCNTSSISCSLSQLRCGRGYNVTVTARHQNCTSKPSDITPLHTGPCPPQGLSVTFHCSNLSAVLTWTHGSLGPPAGGYYGRGLADGVEEVGCFSRGSSCCIDGLSCGAVYNFSVKALDGTCNSTDSDSVESGAVPCPPTGLEVELMEAERELQWTSFEWTPATCGGSQYLLTLTGSLLGDGHARFELSSYWNNVAHFEMPLPCSSTYTATVESRNAAGNSVHSPAISGVTAPCPPTGVEFSVNSSVTSVSWNAGVLAVSYTVYDNSARPRVQLCHTVQPSCSLTNVSSTDLLVTATNQAGESQPANATHAAPEQRRRRRDVHHQMDGNPVTPQINVVEVSASLVFIQWSALPAASSYTLTLRKQGVASEDGQLTVFGESIILTELSPASYYCFSVRGVSLSGEGPESELVCVQTDNNTHSSAHTLLVGGPGGQNVQ